MEFTKCSESELKRILEETGARLAEYKKLGLKLDLTRGKPGREQLDITSGMLGVIADSDDCFAEDGLDCRNYGVLDGLPESKRLFSELLGIPEKNILVCGNSSLNLMYDTTVRAMLFGAVGGEKPWGKCEEVKFLCPSPGYDRHFAICQALGIKMIPIEMTENGPDMDTVEEYVETDPSVKGIWCVPKFSNPDGITYSPEVVERFASLRPAAPDFRIFWDNAYAVHELTDETVELADIFEAASRYGNEDFIYYFASTSKITFPGSGVAIMAASDANIAEIKKSMATQTIGFDKINQMRHVKYFKNAEGILAHMKEHAKILQPKFKTVTDIFKAELGGLGIATWNEPLGGYFISLNVSDGCAKRVYALAAEAGVKLTAAGAAFPYSCDPRDRHLRIAPTFPSNKDLALAIEILTVAVKYAAAEKLLRELR